MEAEKAKEYLEKRSSHDFSLVDVREPWEYEEFHLPGAKLIPLAQLSDRLGEVSPKKPALVYCRSGNRSASAVSLMMGQGFEEVYNLVGGVMAWRGDYAVGPWDAGIYHFTGKETPLEILGVAFAMETNLKLFYTEMASSKKGTDLQETFSQLARFEEGHQVLLVRIAKDLGAEGDIRKDLEARGNITAVEGGWTPGDLLKERNAFLRTAQEAVEAAMMFEAQALDLYLRTTMRIQNSEGRTLLSRLADQEKEHLKVLARLLDRKRASSA